MEESNTKFSVSVSSDYQHLSDILIYLISEIEISRLVTLTPYDTTQG